MPIEAPGPIVPLTPGDVGAAMALVREAGWNQAEADWSAMLRLGEGFGMHAGGRLVASSVVMPYATCGWIGMVLVNGPFRRRGLATRLLGHALLTLRSRSLVPWLDATPAGRPVYEALGFAAVAAIQRWRGRGRGMSAAVGPQPSEAALARAATLDAAAFGSGRQALLRDLAGREGAFVLCAEGGAGCAFARRGRTAMQIGPLLAADEGVAVALLDRALGLAEGPVLLDVPLREAALADLLRARGFAVERPFTRMALGAGGTTDMDPALRAIAGPELG